MMGGAAIEVINYSYTASRREILKNITFSVEEGDYLSILGPNGAGKSTLLKSINRIIGGGKGTIQLFGKDIRQLSTRELARIVSYVPQTQRVSFPITLWQFVLLGRYAYLKPFGSVSFSDRAAVDRALEMTNLHHFKDRALNTLSGGEQQKAYIAAAIAQDAKIILLDEPTTFLDPRYKYEVLTLLEHLNMEGKKTILEVTHDINFALLFSKKTIALKEGELIFSGRPKSILNSRILKSLYETDFILVEHPTIDGTLVFPCRESKGRG